MECTAIAIIAGMVLALCDPTTVPQGDRNEAPKAEEKADAQKSTPQGESESQQYLKEKRRVGRIEV